jgi:hypothetical protein
VTGTPDPSKRARKRDPISQPQEDPEFHDRDRQQRATAKLAVFLAHARSCWSFIYSDAELQALLEVLAQANPKRLVSPEALEQARADLTELDAAWECDDEVLMNWLVERTHGTRTSAIHPLPNPWMRRYTDALWNALVARGVDVVDSRSTPRMLPLTCVLLAILGAESALARSLGDQETPWSQN